MSTPDSIAMPTPAPPAPAMSPLSGPIPGSTQTFSPSAAAGSVAGDAARRLDTPEMIDRLATEMRARSGGELPHSYYVDAVRRKLGGQTADMPEDGGAANDAGASAPTKAQAEPGSSVFHAWAIGER